MGLLTNPFHILGATTRDNRQRIMELADEQSLLSDSADCSQASSDLLNPRKRLSAEIAWLPGVNPRRSAELLFFLKNAPLTVITLTELEPLAYANLLASCLTCIPNLSPENTTKWILALARTFESINPEAVYRTINEDRIAAGFPEITDKIDIEKELQERRKYYCKNLQTALAALPSSNLVKVVTVAVESATDVGEKQGPVLLDDLIDAYTVETKNFLEAEEKNIKILLNNLVAAAESKSSDAVLNSWVDKLTKVVKNWDLIAQPIQVSTKSRGLGHPDSQRVAGLIRDASLSLWNKHEKLELTQRLTNLLQEVFAEVVTVAERVEEDLEALERIEERQAQTESEITYEADIGLVFKDRLRISPEGIEWKGRRWALDSITRIRWGGIRQSVNGIPMGTDYFITFGNESKRECISLKKKSTYTSFINCLWRSVGIRLLTEYLKGLRDGKKYQFGSAVLSDSGMELERKRLFSSNEHVFCRWNELQVGNADGSFYIGKKGDDKLFVALSYQEDDNIHVLEAAVNMLFERGGEKMSSLLGV